MFRGNVITLHRASCDAGFELLGVNVTSRVGDVADLLRVSWFVSSVVVKCGGSEVRRFRTARCVAGRC